MDHGYYTLKLKNGTDIISKFSQKDPNTVTLEDPLELHLSPTGNFFAKSFLLHSNTNIVDLSVDDLLFYNIANSKSIELYEFFMKSIENQKFESEKEKSQSKENVITGLFDQGPNTKH